MEISYSELDEDEWLQDLTFLTDVMEHFANIEFTIDLSQFSFQTKLKLFQMDIKKKTFCYFLELNTFDPMLN